MMLKSLVIFLSLPSFLCNIHGPFLNTVCILCTSFISSVFSILWLPQRAGDRFPTPVFDREATDQNKQQPAPELCEFSEEKDTGSSTGVIDTEVTSTKKSSYMSSSQVSVWHPGYVESSCDWGTKEWRRVRKRSVESTDLPVCCNKCYDMVCINCVSSSQA